MSKILFALLAVVVMILIFSRREKFSLAPGVEKRVVMYHFMNWCPACNAMRPRYEAVKAALSPNGISFYENDEAKRPTAGVNAYPTITVIDEFGKRHQKVGVTSFDDLIAFITTPYYYVS